MAAPHHLIAGQIGQRARHPHNSVEAARRERELFQQFAQGLAGLFTDRGHAVQFRYAQSSIYFALARILARTRRFYPRQHIGAAFARFLLHQFGGGEAGHFDG